MTPGPTWAYAAEWAAVGLVALAAAFGLAVLVCGWRESRRRR